MPSRRLKRNELRKVANLTEAQSRDAVKRAHEVISESLQVSFDRRNQYECITADGMGGRIRRTPHD